MSFHVDATTKTITMHRGDTGEVTISVTGHTFGTDDRALFTVKDGSGSEIIKRVYELDENEFTVTFANSDTDYLAPGQYSWDVRYVIDPQYDPNTGEIVDGDGVSTPGSPYALMILGTVGQI